MPRIVKEMSLSDLPKEWRTQVGSAKTVRVTIEPIDSKDKEGGTRSFEEFVAAIPPSEFKDGWDAVSLVRSIRDGGPKPTVGKQ